MELTRSADDLFVRLVGGDEIRSANDATEELEEAGLVCWGRETGYLEMTNEGANYAAERGLH